MTTMVSVIKADILQRPQSSALPCVRGCAGNYTGIMEKLEALEKRFIIRPEK